MEITIDKTVGVEILRQLGGNKFITMTGAKGFIKSDNSLQFKIPRSKDSITHIKITLNAMDTYDIEYKSVYGITVKTVDTFEGAYNDMLQDVISNRTGLILNIR